MKFMVRIIDFCFQRCMHDLKWGSVTTHRSTVDLFRTNETFRILNGPALN
jgi:hypothetical protein